MKLYKSDYYTPGISYLIFVCKSFKYKNSNYRTILIDNEPSSDYWDAYPSIRTVPDRIKL